MNSQAHVIDAECRDSGRRPQHPTVGEFQRLHPLGTTRPARQLSDEPILPLLQNHEIQVIDMVSHDFRPDADSLNIQERRRDKRLTGVFACAIMCHYCKTTKFR